MKNLLVFSILLIFLCCNDDQDFEEVLIWVSPELTNTVNGHGEQIKLLKIMKLEVDSDEYELIHIPNIQGLDYEEGYSYILYVRIEANELAESTPEAYPYVYTHTKTVLKEKVN